MIKLHCSEPLVCWCLESKRIKPDFRWLFDKQQKNDPGVHTELWRYWITGLCDWFGRELASDGETKVEN